MTLETVPGQEAEHGGGVVVVLVLGRLHRLGLDEELALEADLGLVLRDQVQESGELRAFAAKVRVQKRVVTLTTAPQHVVLATQAQSDFHHVLDLRGGVGEHLRIWIRGSPGLEAAVREQVGRAP